MKFIETVQYAAKSLHQRKMRSWLTILGIVIGIAAVVSLLAIGEGFNEQVSEQLGSLGSNTVFVTPLSDSASSSAVFSGGPGSLATSGKLFQKDADRLERIAEIDVIARLLIGRASIGFKDKDISAQVSGIEPGVFEETTAIEIEEGRFLSSGDQKVAVIGASVAEDFFDNHKVGVNSFLTINDKKFRVIGILKKSGGGFGPTSQTDTGIYVLFEDAQDLFSDSLAENEIGAIALTLKEGSDIDEVTDAITTEIAASHKVRTDDKDFSVINPKVIQERVGSILGLLTVFLGALAGISLLVGGVGIANSMFTSVIERTREIGVLKAVGATRDDILKIFIYESVFLGMAGGIGGVLVGSAIALLAQFFGAPAAIKLEILLFGIVFSSVVGLISGFIPARRAADLSPVDALRYE